MYTSSHIRRHINRLAPDAIFSTREFLNYGKRAAVDKCLSRLVKRGDIVRLAWGLFKNCDGKPLPSPLTVATHKVRAFGKQIATYAADAAKTLGLFSSPDQGDYSMGNLPPEECSFASQSMNELVYSINAHSSKFRYGQTLIRVQGISHRKMSLGDSTTGLALRALWSLGPYNCTRQSIMDAARLFTRQERHELRQLGHLLPAWLADRLRLPNSHKQEIEFLYL